MNFNQITTLVVTVIVVVLISAAAIVPVVQEAQSSQKTDANNTSYYYKATDSIPDCTIVADNAGWKIDNEVYTVTVNSWYQVLICDNFQIFCNWTSASSVLAITDLENATATNLAAPSALTIDDGVISYTMPGAEEPTEVELSGDIYISTKNTNAEYGFYRSASVVDININEDSIITSYLVCPFTIGGNTVSIRGIVSGTYDDLAFVSAINQSSGTVVEDLSDLTVTLPEASIVEHDGYLSIHGVPTVTYTVSGTTYTNNNPGTGGWLAPVKYTYISQNDSIIIALLGIIPVLLFVVPILMIVRSYYNGRD